MVARFLNEHRQHRHSQRRTRRHCSLDRRAEEVVVGKHGVVIKRDFHRGVLLPQVAVEHGWTRQEFLEHTCGKAGLPANAWRDPGTQIEVFEAEVFSESR